MAKTKSKANKLLHHPGIRKEIRRGPKLAALLIKNSGWVEGPLPPQTEPAPVTPAGQDAPVTQDEPTPAPAKKAASKSEGK